MAATLLTSIVSVYMGTHRINFTKATLEALPNAQKGFDFYFDINKAAPRGFGMWVTQAGSKTFSVYRKIKGRPERIKVGSFPDMPLEKARKIAETLNAQIAEGVNPNEERRYARGELTLGALFREYMERHAKVKTKRWMDIEAIFENHLSKWQNRKLSNIRRSDVQRWHAEIGTNCGPYIANRCLQLLRAVINWGIKQAGLVDPKLLDKETNPATGIVLFAEKKRERFLQGDEAPRFFRALAEEPSADMRDLFLLALLTGARRTNVASMRWPDINLERAEWRIPDTKSGEEHTVPLVPQAIDILARRSKSRNESDYVFPSNSVTGYIVSPKKAWRRILNRAELIELIEMVGTAQGWSKKQLSQAFSDTKTAETKALKEYRKESKRLKLRVEGTKLIDFRIHDLRRSLGSWQAATGASLTIIGKSLGHKTAAATQVYARLNLNPVRESMERATNALFNTLSPSIEKPN